MERGNSEAETFRYDRVHLKAGLPANRSVLCRNGELHPLVWPERFPPADWWGRFFTGIPPFGPSVSFFRHLEKKQASRTSMVMASWSDARQREVALKLGECLQTLGWKTPYFIPGDQVLAVIGGPSFVSYVQQDLAYLLDEFNRRLERKLDAAYLRSVIDWYDGSVSLGQLVGKVSAELERKPSEVLFGGINRLFW